MTEMQNFAEEIAKNPDLTKEEKAILINAIYTSEQNRLEKDLKKLLAKRYVGGSLDCISYGIPFSRVGKTAASVSAKSLEKIFGKKISQVMADWMMRGLASGSLHGAGTALVDDKPILKNTVQNALTYAALMGSGAGSVKNIIKNKAAQNLMKYKDFGSLNKIQKAEYLEDVRDFYRDYERGKYVYRKDLGKIKLPSDQMTETAKQAPNLARHVTTLSKDLKNAEYIGVEIPKHDHPKYKITEFHRLRGKNGDYLISQNVKNDKYFYKIAEPNPFTTEQIARMSPEEFSKNEPLIMEQMKKGLIQSEKKNIDFKSFKNPESGKNIVYTREDILKMSSDEFSKHEKEINAQMRSIGIPEKKDIPRDILTFTKQKRADNPPPKKDGKWVTINGNHVMIDK